MDKNIIRLTENELKKIIKESVNAILTEVDWNNPENMAAAGAVAGRHDYRASKGRDSLCRHRNNGGKKAHEKNIIRNIHNHDDRAVKAAEFIRKRTGVENPHNDKAFLSGYRSQYNTENY